MNIIEKVINTPSHPTDNLAFIATACSECYYLGNEPMPKGSLDETISGLGVNLKSMIEFIDSSIFLLKFPHYSRMIKTRNVELRRMGQVNNVEDFRENYRKAVRYFYGA